MKPIFIAILVICAAGSSYGKLRCDVGSSNVATEWLDMTAGCIDKVRHQIQTEINASMMYLAMAAHFSQDTVNRPGFAEFFFHSASEEREHAMKLIEYLLMRGEFKTSADYAAVGELMQVNVPVLPPLVSGVAALEQALKAETFVTKSIKDVIETCERDNDKNDYHLVDYLTAEFLDEQYKGQRDLAGKISTLQKMMKTESSAALGEFLFDKQLL
ncbi:Ferritin subunit [Pseudolycoriella hygida]|uniref:Ferritin n=1 Tax=Pseudolycoriella hygida TaxID=35572 RepID=A0A9Q0RZW4_9DIPT|nr:Ferritin subunit [Pseudolycoriella hygida]